MRVPLFLIVLAAAGSVHAADSINVGHRVIPDAGEAEAKPMAWRYHLLQTAQDVFDEHVATQAPGAALAFLLLGQLGTLRARVIPVPVPCDVVLQTIT